MELVSIYSYSYFFCAGITVQFEQDMYVVQESDGMVNVSVVTSGKAAFSYKLAVTSMDITATSKLDGV